VSAKRRIAFGAFLVPVILVLGLVVTAFVDSARRGDVVGRNVAVAGIELDGLTRAGVVAVADGLTSELAGDAVTLSTGRELLSTTAGELGASVDAERLADDALEARSGPLLLTPLRWVRSFLTTVELQPSHVVDAAVATEEAQRLADEGLDGPVEPILVVEDGEVRVVEGSTGETIDPRQVVERLPAVLDGPEPYVVTADPVPLPPETDTAALQAVADDANATVTGPLTVRVEARSTELETAELRDWLRVEEASWYLDPDAIAATLQPRFPGLGGPDQRARFDVVNGTPVIIPARETVVCCAEDSGDRIVEALRSGADEVVLDTTTSGDDGVAELEALGIVEQVSTFTTNHACCENRVVNIQRFADAMRGVVIRPGETLSLNGVVGQRTEAKGFLPAGAIVNGVLEPQVGGGVSQFSTTFFNAAFFAGLDWLEYQAHSIYFSRYPRGREATISWTRPDQIVVNNTPYGILVWPTYTATSITVTFYSTKNVEVRDLGTVDTPQGACTRVTTTRERRWADGRVERDTVFAVYRPAEGIGCDGQPTRPPGDTPPTTAPPTTAPPTTAPPTTAPPTTPPPTEAPPPEADGEG
jgi:vancomycin resistance protein YoaR